MDSMLVSKVARLTNDGSALGPGSYNVDSSSKVIAPSPRGAVKWSNSKTARRDHFTKTHNQMNVGPGSYQPNKTSKTVIANPTIPRADLRGSSLGFKI